MADIFISYKRENLGEVQRLVQALRQGGVSVWWDQDIAPDAPWEATIERELEAAKVVIVAWSVAAVASENVKSEARQARGAGKLIQIFIEDCAPPLFFGERQGVNLSAWSGAADDRRFQTVLEAARAVVAGKRPPQGVGYAPPKGKPWAVFASALAAAAALIGLIADLGGARSALCSVSTVNSWCKEVGLVAKQTTSFAEDERTRLLQGLVGSWGMAAYEAELADGRKQKRENCETVVSYRLERGEDGAERIVGRYVEPEEKLEAGGEKISFLRVVAVDNGAVVARATDPTPDGAFPQWEFRPDGDRLSVYDQNGRASNLIRCGGSGEQADR